MNNGNTIWTIRYMAVVTVITIVVAVVGVILWNSEDQQVLSGMPDGECESWCLGPANAPVTLEAFVDFT